MRARVRVRFHSTVCLCSLDNLLTRIKEEVRRLQRRHQLKVSSSDAHEDEPSASVSATTDPSSNQQPLLTLKQVNMICARLLQEREEKVREEYDRILSSKLNGNSGHARLTAALIDVSSRAIRRFRSIHPGSAHTTFFRIAILL